MSDRSCRRAGQGISTLLILALCAFGRASRATPQDTLVKTAPKIGIVLSGGGARGLAHIGVLQWLEENRIPVDAIVGTSMGGLIGGMYAMGMTPADMRALVEQADWKQALASGPGYDRLSYRRKEDRRDYQVELEMGIKRGFHMPTGLSSAHEIGLMISRLTFPYSTIPDFDSLPIPYRCVAVDFLAGQTLALKNGSLASAMRATMSVPGVFPPVERDGLVLVDGGLLNNIPTDVIRELRPDIVIAVDVGAPLGDRQEIESLGGILSQSTKVMLIENDRRNLRLADVIITPELGERTILDFSSAGRIIDLGYAAAGAQEGMLRKLSLDETAWQQHQAAIAARIRKVAVTPDEIEITGVRQEGQAYLHRRLAEFAGRPLNLDRLESVLTGITGEGRFASLDYGFARSGRDAAKTVLLVHVKEKTYAPPTLDFSLDLTATDISDIDFSVGARLTACDVTSYGSEWRNDLKVGTRTLLATELFQPLGRRGLFAAPYGYYRRGIERLLGSGSTPAADYTVNRVGAGLDIGYLGRRGEVRAGYDISWFEAGVHTGTPPITSIGGKVDMARVRWTFDGMDSASVPARGLRIAAEGRWILSAPLAEGSYPQAEITALFAQPVSRRGSLIVSGQLGTTFTRNAAPELAYTLGGPWRLGAYNRDEFRGNHYFLTGLGYRHHIAGLSPLLGGKIFALASFESGGAFLSFAEPDIQYQGSAGLIMETRLGPFSLMGAAGRGGRGKIYFTFGRFF